MVRRVLGAVTILLALMLAMVLSACTGDSKADDPPTTTPPASESPSPSESATPEKPEMPDAAKQPTEAGAIEFVRHYWLVVHYAGESGDFAELRSLADQSCAGCAAGLERYEEIHDAGGRVVGSPGQLSAVEAVAGEYKVSGKSATLATVRFKITMPPSTHYYGPDDKRNEEFAGGSSDLTFELTWRSGACQGFCVSPGHGRWGLIRSG